MNRPLSFLFHTSIHLQMISLLPHTVLFLAGALLGYFSWVGLVLGTVLGLCLGVRFWAETRGPRIPERYFPVTDTQKAGYLVVLLAYAVFLGCVVDRVSEAPSAGFVKPFLAVSLYATLGSVLSFTLTQCARLCWFSLHGGKLDRLLVPERPVGPGGVTGLTGVVTERIAPQGKVRVRGELWNAESAEGQEVKAGRRVTVVEVRGLTLLVRPGTPRAVDRS